MTKKQKLEMTDRKAIKDLKHALNNVITQYKIYERTCESFDQDRLWNAIVDAEKILDNTKEKEK